jgi:hypothetical protein
MNKDFVEECWFVYGIRIFRRFIGFRVYHSSGTPSQVQFSWEKALSKFLIGWVHTHPKGHTHVSYTDDKTMRGWTLALGKPLLCGVVCDGSHRGWQYWKKRPKSRKCAAVCRREISIYMGKNIVLAYIPEFDSKKTDLV